jgi:MATE family multidrug resistance protein
MRDTEKDMEESLLSKGIREDQRRSVTPSLTWATFTVELKRLGFLAGPMVTVTLSQYLLQAISMMMVGHLGELALSSTAIAISLSGVTGFSLLVSLSFYPLYIFVFVLAYSICFSFGGKIVNFTL